MTGIPAIKVDPAKQAIVANISWITKIFVSHELGNRNVHETIDRAA
jgi:hypothetical protein